MKNNNYIYVPGLSETVADEVKKEMIQVASAMAGKVVAANIDTTVSDSLIDETLKEIGESTWLD